MPAKIVRSDLWFKEAFSDPVTGAPYPVPGDIRDFAEFLCRQHGIRGTSDPMYIANITALELGYGDGRSHFYAGLQPGMSARRETFDQDTVRLAGRLHHAYSTVFSARKVTEAGIATIIRARIAPPGAPTHSERFAKIGEIAERVQPLEDRYAQAWATFDRDPIVPAYRTLAETVAQINAELAKEIPLLAELTGNSASALQSLAPRDEVSVWFNDRRPAEYLRKVMKYGSFNENYWASRERLNSEEAAAQLNASAARARP